MIVFYLMMNLTSSCVEDVLKCCDCNIFKNINEFLYNNGKSYIFCKKCRNIRIIEETNERYSFLCLLGL